MGSNLSDRGLEVARSPMHTSITAADVRREWGQIQRRAKRDPGVVHLGYQTGQLAVHFGATESRPGRVFVKAISAPALGSDPATYYHAIVHEQTDEGERRQRREQFRHPFPALDWLHEIVPDFDLLETVTHNAEAATDATDDSSPPSDR